MSELHPLTARLLQEFRRRRRRILLWRAAASSGITLVIAMAAVALVDYLWLLADEVRYALSAAAYIGAAAAAWLGGLRRVCQREDDREIAKRLEATLLDMKQDILAAVEIGESGSKTSESSPLFRHLIQENVASRISGQAPEALLPLAIIKRWLAAAAALIAACLLAAAWPDSPVGALLLRACAPLANLDRISAVKISILMPKPAETRAALGDILPVLVKLDGAEASEAYVECFEHEGRRTLIRMQPQGDRRFLAQLAINKGDLRYRIRAGDGLTRKYAISARPRPQVARFYKRYEEPSYTGRPPRETVELNGDLAAIANTVVTLGIACDQPLSAAELRVTMAGEHRTIALAQDKEGRWQGNLALQANGVYLVHLVAAETGFTNRFAAEYEIRVTPDLVPEVALLAPQRDANALPTDLLPIAGVAKDDVGLAQVLQCVSINHGPWQETALTAEGKTEVKFSRLLDLAALPLSPGDSVAIKLAAIDRKDNRAESQTAHISIVSSALSQEALAALAARRTTTAALTAMRAAAENLAAAAAEAVRRAGEANVKAENRQEAIAMAERSLRQAETEAERAFAALRKAIGCAETPQPAADLALLGTALSETRQRDLRAVADKLAEARQAKTAGEAQKMLAESAAAAQQATERSRQAEEAAKTLLAADAAAAALQNAQALAAEQARLREESVQNNGPATEQQRERIQRQQTAVAKESGLLADLLAQARQDAPAALAQPLESTAQQLQGRREAVEKELKAADRRAVPSGFAAEYFADHQWQKSALKRLDPAIRFDWGNGSPDPTVPADNFACRWQATIVPPLSGPYTFILRSDDGARLWLGDKLLIDNWDGIGERVIHAELEAAKPCQIKVEYRENGGAAHAYLEWQPPDLPRAVLGGPADLPRLTQEMKAALEQTVNNLRPLAQHAQAEAQRWRERLQQNTGDAADILAEVRQQVEAQPDAGQRSSEPPKPTWQKNAEAAAARLRDRAALEESKPDADFAFSHDAGRVASALSRMAAAANADRQVANESLKRYEEALRMVEADKKMAETVKRLQDVAAREAFRDEKTQAAIPRSWQEVEAATNEAAKTLEKAQLSPDKRQRWANLLQDQDAQRSREEMARRQAGNPIGRDLTESLVALRQKAEAARQLARPEVETARQRIAEAAPRLHEEMEELAKGFKHLANRLAEAEAAKAKKEAAAAILPEQEKLAAAARQLQDDLRRDAGPQDLSTAEGRNRSRDADDAIARLKRPPPTVADHLRDAMAAPEEKAAGRSLRAATEQAKAAAADLQRLAQHYRHLDLHKPEAELTRHELRKDENEQMKSALDQRYAESERLAKMMRLPAAELAKQLAAEAKNNSSMRREMAVIAQAAAASAKAHLRAAAQAESELAGKLANLPDAVPQNADALREAHKRWEEAAAKAGAKAVEARQAQAAAEQQQRLAQAMQEAGHPEAAQAQAAAQQANHEAGQKIQAAQAAAQEEQNAYQGLMQVAQADQTQAAMANLSRQQREITEKASAAARDLQRATRHAAHLSDRATANKAQEAASHLKRLQQGEMFKASESLRTGQSPAPARPAVAAAQQGLERGARDAEALEAQMVARARAEEAQPIASEAEARLGKWLARALDAAERQAAGAEAENSKIQAALARAAQEQRAAMAAATRGHDTSSGSPSSETALASAGGSAEPAPETAVDGGSEKTSLPGEDWARLRRRDAADLAAGRKEEVGEEYRAMVEAYFKAVAAEARR